MKSSSPEKGGACTAAHAPEFSHFNSPQNNSTNGFAQGCAHTHTVTVREPLGRIHYSRETCIVCRTFLRWLPKPSPLAARFLEAKTAMSLDGADIVKGGSQ